MRKIAVVFLGKPGAGKGTQADLLADDFIGVHFNTGEIIRRRIANPQTDEDRREKAIYDSGRLNTLDWVTGMVVEKAHAYWRSGQSVVLSGSPRSLYEAERLIPELIQDYGKDNVYAVLLDIDDNDAVLRNTSRLTCTGCGFTPNITAERQNDAGQCPQCGAVLIRRTIDTKEKILGERLPAYNKTTAPAVDYIRGLGILHEIDGRLSKEEVFAKIMAIIRKE